jgi:hypothetical protein
LGLGCWPVLAPQRLGLESMLVPMLVPMPNSNPMNSELPKLSCHGNRFDRNLIP